MPYQVSRRLRTIGGSLAALVVAASLLTSSPANAVTPASETLATSTTRATPAATGVVKSANLALFRPGNIISDQVFFNSSTMSTAQIDTFFRSKVSSCRSGYTCLKDYRQNTPNRPADKYCRGYSGAANESAATIIARVAQSCGINPQVLIVMLQKEQGLVTHTWPSQWRYDKALGQGCPDTAPCDPAFAGFFYQIYGAARQMQIYAEGRWFTYYAPGKTWNIRYHPNAACGSAPVYVENTATSALYYYTPYQPNRAALNAGYGEGDACSAYGNRNFYQYFTDWFGSTQVGSPLVHAAGQPNIYLVLNGSKHRVATPEDLTVFRSRYGAVAEVSASYVDALPTGRDATRYVHDARSGTLYVLDPDGTKHRFANADQVARFGYSFNSYLNLPPTLIDLYPTGADVTDFFRIWDGPDLYLADAGKKRHIASYSMWQTLSRGTSGYVAFLPSSAATALPPGPVVLEPNTLVRPASTGDVYVLLGSGALLHIPSFALAAEFGATRYLQLPDASVSANPRIRGSLSPIVTCAGTAMVPAGGAVHTVTGTDFGGVSAIALSTADCSAFPKSSAAYATPLFVQASGMPEVYAFGDGGLKHVRAYATLQALNGNRPLRILTWSRTTVDDVGLRAPHLGESEFVRFSGLDEVYQFRNGQLRHVRDYSTLLKLNNGRVPSIVSLQKAWLSDYEIGAPFLADGSFVQFDGTSEVYTHTNGIIRHVQSYATLIRLGKGRQPTIIRLPVANKSAYQVGAPIP